jgi:hypothetical protein
MRQQMSGPRGDGQPWPAPGSMMTVGGQEGRDLVRAGIADEVPDPPAKEAPAKEAPAPPAGEERAVVTSPVEDRAPSGTSTQNTPAARPRAARAR